MSETDKILCRDLRDAIQVIKDIGEQNILKTETLYTGEVRIYLKGRVSDITGPAADPFDEANESGPTQPGQISNEHAIKILKAMRAEWDTRSKCPNAAALDMAIEALEAETERNKMCETCIHKVSASDLDAIREDAIEEMKNFIVDHGLYVTFKASEWASFAARKGGQQNGQ